MSDCCSNPNTAPSPKRHCCPINGQEYKEVSARTILHHLKEPWFWEEKQQNYYFCEDPACDVVYFGEDDTTICTSRLRTAVGIKQKNRHGMLCYCFGISYASVAENPEIKAFITAKTKSGACACETRNPSGKCCLKDFPK